MDEYDRTEGIEIFQSLTEEQKKQAIDYMKKIIKEREEENG